MDTDVLRPQDRFTQIGNIQARYWAEGSQGSPVILIHGLGGYVETFWPNIKTLAHEHRVYAPDLPGCGRTEKPTNGAYHIQGFVQFIQAFMKELGLKRASLVGHSMGGAIALQFTLAYPEIVDRLVLVSSAGMGREIGFPLRLISLPLLGELLSRPSLHGSRSFAEDLVFDKSLIIDEDVQFDYEISCLPGSQQALLKTLRSLGSFGGQKRSFYGPILEKLSTIAQPTLVLWGREDTIVPVQHSEAARKIPNARIHIFEHCRHMPQFEHIVEFDQALQAFLRD